MEAPVVAHTADIERGAIQSSSTAWESVEDTRSSSEQQDPPPIGFPGLAKQIAQDPDQETFVFRKFNRLTAWNLVFKENELAVLEKELGHQEDLLLSDPDAMVSATTWAHFEKRAQEASTPEHNIMELTKRISGKLTQYHEALSSASNIAHLTQPSDRVVGVLKHMQDENGLKPDFGVTLQSKEQFKDRQRRKKDLVALKVSSDNDIVTRYFRNHWPEIWTKGSDLHTDDARFFQDSIVTGITRALSVVLAVILLVGSILTLYYVRGDSARLGILMAYIIIFAFGVALTTGANRDSIFASTAAYAAVLIVFISGDLNKTDSLSTMTMTSTIQEAVTSAIQEAVTSTIPEAVTSAVNMSLNGTSTRIKL